MFDTIASRYDLVNHIMSFNFDKCWRKKASLVISAGHPGKILDAACGTADLSIEMHIHMPEAEITGIDISEEMLAIGRRKIERLKKSRGMKNSSIVLKPGDAVNINSDGEMFDTVTIAFGIRNISERQLALKEFHRVLKKKGKLMVLEFSIPEKGLFSLIYKMYFNYILPYLGGITSGNFKAYRYFVRSVKEFPSPEKFTALLGECGFTVEQAIPLTGGAAWIYLAAKADK